MDFRDLHGEPLVKWTNAVSAFKAWARHSKGWFCDYSGLSYKKLSAGTDIQWPCDRVRPKATERIYADSHFMTAASECETFGHDLETGAPITPDDYKAHDPAGSVVVLIQVAQGLRDREMLDACLLADEHVKRVSAWLRNQVKHRAVHTLVVPN